MSKFNLYVLKVFIKYFFIVLTFIFTISMLYLIISRMNGSMRKYDPTIFQMLRYALFTVPMELRNTMPIVLVVTSIITVLLFVRSNELLAYVSIGGRLHLFILPFLLAATVIASAMIFFDFKLNTYFRIAQKRFESEVFRKQKYTPNQERLFNLWTMDNRKLVNIDFMDSINLLMDNITEYYLDDDFKVSSIRFIDHANFDSATEEWIYTAVKQTDFTAEPPIVTLTAKSREENKLLSEIGSFLPKLPKLMSLSELYTVIKFMRSRGMSTARYEMYLWEKYASALSTLILIILVVPMGISFSRQHSPIISAVTSLGLGAAFWITLSTLNSLGYSRHIPAFAANFAPHVLFLAVGIALLYRKEKAA